MGSDRKGALTRIWQPQANGELVNPQSGKCLDDNTDSGGGSGTQLQIWGCWDGANQQWNLP